MKAYYSKSASRANIAVVILQDKSRKIGTFSVQDLLFWISEKLCFSFTFPCWERVFQAHQCWQKNESSRAIYRRPTCYRNSRIWHFLLARNMANQKKKKMLGNLICSKVDWIHLNKKVYWYTWKTLQTSYLVTQSKTRVILNSEHCKLNLNDGSFCLYVFCTFFWFFLFFFCLLFAFLNTYETQTKCVEMKARTLRLDMRNSFLWLQALRIVQAYSQ